MSRRLTSTPGSGGGGSTLNGATVPAAGALVTGNVLQVNGVASTTYAPVNLAGGSNYVTGALPLANQVSQTTIDTFANRPASPITGQEFIPSDGGFRQIYDGSAWRPLYGNTLATEPPTAATFGTALGSPTSLVKTNGSMIMVVPGSLSLASCGYVKSIPTPSACSIEFSCSSIHAGTTAAQECDPGAWMRESTSNRAICVSMGAVLQGTFTSWLLNVGLWTALTTRSAGAKTYQFCAQAGAPVFARIAVVSTNVVVSVSFDGATYFTIQTTPTNTVFSTAPDTYGPNAVTIASAGDSFSAYYPHVKLV